MEEINLLIRNPYLAEYEFRLQVRRTLTVALLKQELAHSYEGQPSAESQRLIYAGRLLQDQELIGELLVVETEDNEHVIFLAIKRTAGDSPPSRATFHSSSPSTVTQTVFTSSSFSFPAPMSYDTSISFASPPRYAFSATEESPQSPLSVPSPDSSLLSGHTPSLSTSHNSSCATATSQPIPPIPTPASPTDLMPSVPVLSTAATATVQSTSTPPFFPSEFTADHMLSSANYNEAVQTYLSQAHAYYNWMAQMYAFQYHMYCSSQAVAETPVLYGRLWPWK